MKPATGCFCTIKRLHHCGNLVEMQTIYRLSWSILKVLPAFVSAYAADCRCLDTVASGDGLIVSSSQVRSPHRNKPQTQCQTVLISFCVMGNIGKHPSICSCIFNTGRTFFFKLRPPQKRNMQVMHDLQTQERTSSKDLFSHDKSASKNIAAKESCFFQFIRFSQSQKKNEEVFKWEAQQDTSVCSVFICSSSRV